ncbi:TetR/AcrR family transcriptional regulator [Leptothoe sp. PORK10 BA2]|nr:TetR/AcrR family transcriptional regulator [Leptothoe sp. PORK10 BA2]MEA5463878.1 TetR/AcrR family transcriptional regulator [Leptothoe sp. PORK10 BA2]
MPESPATSSGMRRKPRQARSQERVNRILDVAEDLFASQGYTATTTNAISTQAQVANRNKTAYSKVFAKLLPIRAKIT